MACWSHARVSHVRAVTTDPGSIPEHLSYAPENFANPRVCKLCQAL